MKIGDAYIINEFDRPYDEAIVIVTSVDAVGGECRYLRIANNRAWETMRIDPQRSTPLRDFGVEIEIAAHALRVRQVRPSVAVYRKDGQMRPWQGYPSVDLPFKSPEPKTWRLDPEVLSVFLAARNLESRS